MADQKKNMSAEEFVRLWQGAETVDDVVKATASTAQRVAARATHLRKLGVKLKKFKPRPRAKRIDVAALNKIVEQIDKRTSVATPMAPKSVVATSAPTRTVLGPPAKPIPPPSVAPRNGSTPPARRDLIAERAGAKK